MKKLILILTGLLLAGGTARAVPTLNVNVTQDEWWGHLDIYVDPLQPAHGYVDGVLLTTTGAIQWDFLVNYRIDWAPIAVAYQVGTHNVLFRLADGTELTGTYEIYQPAGENPNKVVPDGGATALLLGLAMIGVGFVHRRLHPAR